MKKNNFDRSYRLLGMLCAVIAISVMSAASISAATLAYWRFEGTSATNVTGTSQTQVYRVGVEDESGNGNILCGFWDDGANATEYSSMIPPVLAGTNLSSVLNSGGAPSLFTWSQNSSPTLDIETLSLSTWTIEAFVRPTGNGAHQTFVGRDGAVDGNDVSCLYFKVRNDGTQNFLCEFYNSAGGNFVRGTRVVVPGNWYYVAVVCDGTNTTLYSADLTAGETVATQDGDPVALVGTLDPHPDPDAAVPTPRQSWSVGRGFYASGDTDRFYGNIDEVRISDNALNVASEGLLATGLGVANQRLLGISGETEFPARGVGNPTSSTLNVKLESVGALGLTINSLSGLVPGYPTDTVEFATASALPTTLANGESLQVVVTWTPDAIAGTRDVLMIVDSNAENDLSTVTLTGTVLPELTQDLVVYYTFDEATGALLNDTAPDGTATNADVIGRTLESGASIEGIIGNAFSAPGTSTDYAVADGTPGNAARDQICPADFLLGTAATGPDYTLSFWANFANARPVNNGYAILGNVDWNAGFNGNRDGFGAFRNGDDTGQGIIFRSYHDNAATLFGNGEVVLGTGPTPSTWEHFVYVFDRDGDVQLYYNGNLIETDGPPFDPEPAGDVGDPTVPFAIGGLPTDTVGGFLLEEQAFDDLGLWHRALSAVEVQAIYEQGLFEGAGIPDVVSPPLVVNSTRNWAIYE